MPTPQLFGNKSRSGSMMPATQLDQLLERLRSEVNAVGHSFASQKVAGTAISMESADPVAMRELDDSVNTLNHALESITNELPGLKDAKLTVAQRQAATVAGMVAGDIPAFLRAPVTHNVVSTESMKFIGTESNPDALNKRSREALEAYDEKENKNAVTYSVAYNLQAARQDEFGEAFFPTVVVTPDQVGFFVTVRLQQVYGEVRRNISGDLDNFGKKNIIQAIIDPTILKNSLTKIIPVYRDESKAHFVDATVLTPANIVTEDGEAMTTSALAMGKKFSLLGISQSDALLETGAQDSTDSIDTSLMLDSLYIQLVDGATTELFKFNTANLPTATFLNAQQGNYRAMNLNFKTSGLHVSGATKTASGAVSTILAAVTAGNYSIRLALDVSGSVNLELGDTSLFSSDIHVASITGPDGTKLDLTVGVGATLSALFNSAKAIGYTLDAQRTNLNRRMRGQLIDTTYYSQAYAVPLLSPITALRPMTSNDANDSSDLSALITATHIRTSNAAVDELLRVKGLLQEWISSNDQAAGDVPEIMGVARFLLSKPHFEHVNFDVSVQIDSLTSTNRLDDLRSVLVNKLRDMAYRMYRDTGYKAAADALAGGVAPRPTVIIGTDPVIAQYLMVTGDFRTMGDHFDVKIVSTLNQRMRDQIIMSFGDFSSNEGVPNPMHFGNMAWKPELTVVLPLHRNGANSKELTVQPSFKHIPNLPIMASMTVTGIEAVVADKVALNVNNTPTP